MQANFDYSSEEDALRMLRVSLAPLAGRSTAMFANSPFYEGGALGGKSYRAKVWLDVDPRSPGPRPARARARARASSDYIEWALDAPMFLVKRGTEIVENARAVTFRRFMKDGFRHPRDA